MMSNECFCFGPPVDDCPTHGKYEVVYAGIYGPLEDTDATEEEKWVVLEIPQNKEAENLLKKYGKWEEWKESFKASPTSDPQ